MSINSNFSSHVLILLAVFVALLLIVTAIACYYDCENRRRTLPAVERSNTTGSTVPTVSIIKCADEQPYITHKKKIEDVRIYLLIDF